MEALILDTVVQHGQTVWIIPNIPPCTWSKVVVSCGDYKTQSGSYLYFTETCEDKRGTYLSTTSAGNVAKISLTNPLK